MTRMWACIKAIQGSWLCGKFKDDLLLWDRRRPLGQAFLINYKSTTLTANLLQTRHCIRAWRSQVWWDQVALRSLSTFPFHELESQSYFCKISSQHIVIQSCASQGGSSLQNKHMGAEYLAVYGVTEELFPHFPPSPFLPSPTPWCLRSNP